jgi:hypothetical protein
MANFFVSTSGDDSNDGSKNSPFLTIAKGISVLTPGDELNLREGNYVELVKIKGLHGSQANPIVIRSCEEEHATIDGSVFNFRLADNNDWKPALPDDPNAHTDEFVSCATFDTDREHRMNRGAFLDREPYTRLITHQRLEDLRAENQTFEGAIPLSDEREGPAVINSNDKKNPWVYMGPGLFFNTTSDQVHSGRVHIRLSHTTNNVTGIVDYDGETDPRKLRLAISSKIMTALEVEDSSFIRFENLSVRFGGENCIYLKRTKSLVFDHVQIWAAGHGVRFENTTRTILRHCEIRGGAPSWYFRSDRKVQYPFKDGNTVVTNQLGKNTSVALLAGTSGSTDTEIHNCELRDAHDIVLCGQDVRFHHNWIDNLNDESLFIDQIETHDLLVFQNVFTRCLSAISAGGTRVSGPTYIYRNLFDLREPTVGARPKRVDDKDVFRFGQLFKTKAVDGPLHLFQNTCLVFRQHAQSSFLHYQDTPMTNPPGENPRRSFNNIFVAINSDERSNKPITHIPPPFFPGPTDGNCYFRMGIATSHLFVTTMARPDDKFINLEELRSSGLFNQSMTVYPPGYEAFSIEADPQFRQIDTNGTFTTSDDLRLGSESPARKMGIILPADLQTLDPLAPSQGRPDIGCYQCGEPGLRVGVDGRRQFPPKPGGYI